MPFRFESLRPLDGYDRRPDAESPLERATPIAGTGAVLDSPEALDGSDAPVAVR